MTSDRFAAHDVTVLVTYFGRIAPGGSKERDRRKLEVASAAEELDPAKTGLTERDVSSRSAAISPFASAHGDLLT